jgi:membrane-associated protease RseP (regulator of RpoE activity)
VLLLSKQRLILAFSSGVEFPAATVGGTIQGMPAWEAGLRTGDRIVEVDGKPIKEYTEVLLGIAIGERGTKVDIKVERPASKPGGSPATLFCCPVLGRATTITHPAPGN